MILRKLEREDLPIRVKWMNNPKVYTSMHFRVPVTLDKTMFWYEKNMSDTNRYDVAFVASSEAGGGGQIIAFGGVVSINMEISKAETYLFVNPESQHSGFGSEAKRLLCDFAFTELGLNKLYVVTNEDNYASIRLQEKFGYKLEGRFREEYVTAEGKRKDRLYFGLLKKDWNRRHKVLINSVK